MLILSQRKINIILLAVLLVFLTTIILSIKQNKDIQYASKWVVHTHDVLNQLSQTMVTYATVDYYVSDYIETQNKSFIKGIQFNLQKLDNNVAELKKLTLDNIHQQNNLNSLITQIKIKKSITDEILKAISLGKDKKFSFAILNSKKSIAINEAITKTFSNIRNEELTLLKERNSIFYNFFEKNNIITIFRFGVVGLSLLLTFLLINLKLREKIHSEKKLLDIEKTLSIKNKNLLEKKKELEETQRIFSLAVQASNTGLWDWEVGSQHVYYSKELKQILGFNEDEFPDTLTAFEEILHPEDYGRVFSLIREHIDDNVPYNIEYRLKVKSGEYRWFHAIGQAIQDTNTGKIRMSGILVDISARKEIDRIKNEFVSMVSHELRTPLTSIHGSLCLLANGSLGKLTADNEKLLSIAQNNCERLIRLINDILDIQKIESGSIDFHKKIIDVDELIQEALNINQGYAEKFSVKLIQENKLPNIKLLGDYDRLIQVLTNLISNAVKFSSKNSEVKINLSLLPNNMLRIAITDTGSGISDKFKKHIFQKFAQADSSPSRKQMGTGLGLSISKAIIEKHDGTIDYTSSANATTFYFDLPIFSETNKEEEPVKQFIHQLKQPQYRVLICESDQDTANLIKVYLEKENIYPIVVREATEAEDILKNQPIDVLILNVKIITTNNFLFLKRIETKIHQSKLPIIIIDMQPRRDHELIGSVINVIDWIEKPVDVDKLATAIYKIKNLQKLNTISILHVEDDADLYQVVATSLKNEARVDNATTLKQAKDKLEQNVYNAVILDLMLPDGSSLQLIPQLSLHNIPIIIFSAYELPKEYDQYVEQIFLKSKNSSLELIAAIRMALKIKEIDGVTYEEIK